MTKFILEYSTTPVRIDLTGAHPYLDWKGSENLEKCAKKVLDSGIDWQNLHEEKLKKIVILPDETRITRLFFKVSLINQFNSNKEYGIYESYEFPDAMIRQMADDNSWNRVTTGLAIQYCCSFHYPAGNSDECFVLGTIHLLDTEWNACEVSTNWRADRNIFCDTRTFARPGTEACKHYPELAIGKPLSISGLTGCDMFSNPVVMAYDDECLTLRYGKNDYIIKIGEPFRSDDTGRDYTTFFLDVCLKFIPQK